MTTKFAILLVFATLGLFVTSLSAGSQDFESDTFVARIELLRGYNSVDVRIFLNDMAEEKGLSVESLKTDVELRLRSAGIKVVPACEFDDQGHIINLDYVNRMSCASDYPTAQLKIFIDSLAPETTSGEKLGGAISNISIKLDEFGSISRKGHVMSNVFTIWDDAMLITSPPDAFEEHCRGCIKDLTDRFANDYLSMNPL
jgi:hypothetical protein